MYTSREMTRIHQPRKHIPHSSRNVNNIRHNVCKVTSKSVDINVRLYRRRPNDFEVPLATYALLNIEMSAMTDRTKARLCSAGRVYCGNNILNLHKQICNKPKSALYTYTWTPTTASLTLPRIRRSIAGSRSTSKMITIHSSRSTSSSRALPIPTRTPSISARPSSISARHSSISARPSSISARPSSISARPFTIPPAIALPIPTESRVLGQETPDKRNLSDVLPPATTEADTVGATPQLNPAVQQVSPKSSSASSEEDESDSDSDSDSDSLSHGSELTQDRSRKVKHRKPKRGVDKTPIIAKDSRDKEDLADSRFEKLRSIASDNDYSSDSDVSDAEDIGQDLPNSN